MAGTCGLLGNNKVKGPGQNASINKRPLRGNVDRHHAQLLLVDDVDDQRIPRRPLLGLEDSLHRRLVESIRAQSVDGLGRERHRASAAQQFGALGQGRHRCRRIDGVGIDSQPQCFINDHSVIFPWGAGVV